MSSSNLRAFKKMLPEAFVSYDFWQSDPPDNVDISCLMPNGMIIIMKVSQNKTFEEIKVKLWEKAQQYPLYEFLNNKSEYVISVICGTQFGKKGKTEDIHNESIRLCDVQPYFCLLKIVEKNKSTGNPLEKDISHLIGKPVEEFKNLNNPEVDDFRDKMGVIAEQLSEKRKRMTWRQRLEYQYPRRLAKNINIPQSVCDKFDNGKFVIVSRSEIHASPSFKLQVTYNLSPALVLQKILLKMSKTGNKPQYKFDDYILKICGKDEYIYGENDVQIIQFLYVQDVLSAHGMPSFVIQAKKNVDLFKKSIYETTLSKREDRYKDCKLRLGDISARMLKKKQKHTSSWDIKQPFQIRIDALKGLNCDTNKVVSVIIRTGLFHGGKSLCEPIALSKPLSTDGCSNWEKELKFDIMVCNVPRMARLCFVVFVADSKNRVNPIAWVNTTVFDYKHQLKTGDMMLYTWPEDSQSEDWFHPLGTVESNPRTDERAAIILNIYNYNIDNVIVYPNEDRILSYAEELKKTKNISRDSAEDCRSIHEIMSPYLNNDKIQEMVDQDRNAIWAKRNEVQEQVAEGLPCLLHCVEWNDRDRVSEMHRLLAKWKPLSEERALALLDYAYADSSVRSFAVKCLKMLNLTDDEFLLYLLQLVQAIKHESYFQCDLVKFLLNRALHNHRIGHHFFWHLRSEMLVESVQVRFGIILEAYLKGSQEHIPILLKQTSCLEELKKVSEQAQKAQKYNRDKGRAELQKHLNTPFIKQKVEDVLTPLNPSFRCRSIKIDKCKVMHSKKRPLWMVFENSDTHGDDIYVIFKNGDDLRQDMLTLQMLRVMDKIWKSDGFDFRMNPYSCVSTEHCLGMIEIVLNAETIANIQKERGMFSATSPFKKGSLYAWLRDHNPDGLDKAIQEFTLSCAGYCVATYVLGVADRHSDNIMVTKTGQLFHIDFGHILGHFKEKFGFRRERVPFVLAHDFVYIINKGKNLLEETDEFKTFKQLCEKAFLLLRSHGCLILSLFSMMISTGLPELSSEKDLDYLRETLVLEKTEEAALDHFRDKFNEALKHSWKTAVNWAVHNFAKNNTS